MDKSGAVVPEATVRIKNLGTNEIVQVKTSRNGFYAALSLDPVFYSLTVEAKGFKTTVVDQVKVDTAQTATVNVTLEVGAATTEVTVQGASVAVNLESGTTGTTISARELTDIPLINRSVLDLAITQPNITGEAGSEDPAIVTTTTAPGYNLSINGGRPGSSTFLSDGVNNTGVSLARTIVSFTPETVQEFTVQTSNFSAEYGNSGGGIVNVSTKSGTNQFTGTALWYVRNPYFDSPSWVAGPVSAKPPGSNLRYNQFSLSAGGPVVIPKLYHGQNKTFWFAAYEPRYRRDLCTNCSDTYQLLPTDAMRAGDFSNTMMVRQRVGTGIVRLPTAVANQFGFQQCSGNNACDTGIYNHYDLYNGNQFAFHQGTFPAFPGNVIPQNMMDSTALKALAYIPHAGNYFLDPSGNIANFYSPRTLGQDETRYTVRIDHIFSESDKINGRYTNQPTIKTQFLPASPTGAAAEYSYSKQMMIAYTHLFTPSVFNDLRLNYTRGRFSTTIGQQYDVNTGQNLNTILGLPSLTHGGVPSLPFIGGQGSNSQDDTEERYGITDIVYMTRGDMSWKFGVDLAHSLQNQTPLFDAIGGNYDIRALQTGSTSNSSTSQGGDFIASFLLGTPNAAAFRPAILRYHYKWNALAAFAQNDWKILPKLTLNLGLRYNLELPRTEENNLQGVFRPDLTQSYPVPGGAVTVGGLTIPLASIQVPAYAFAGRGGRSRYLYPPSYLNFEPRFGFAWSPDFLSLGGHQMTLRGGYGISHLPVTGTARLPNPDFGFVQNFNPALNNIPVVVNGVNTTCCALRLGENPPVVPALDVNQAVFKNIPANGLLYLQPNGFGSLSMPGFAVSQNRHSPYSQNWNLTLSWEATRRTIVEVSYVGNKSTHLFEGGEDINPRSFDLVVNQLDANNINTDSNTAPNGLVDPLNRRDANGNLIRIATGSLYSPFAGFPAIYTLYDASGNSIRHAGYVYVRHRVGTGLLVTANYTYGKSIDDSQGASDKFVLSTGQVAGQASFGAPRSLDRSVSTFDQKHSFNATFIYDLPFGSGRKFLGNTGAAVNALVGGWATTGIFRVASGYPAWATLVDSNQLGDPANTHQIRPNIVPGVPLKNPLWSSSCPTGPQCQPFLNPSAFERPPLGQFGNAPRTFDGVRGPAQQYFDSSIQKSFSLAGDGKRRLQIRMDLLNAFNHPVFRVGPNNTFTDFMSAPVATFMNANDYNSWAMSNGQATVTSVSNTGACSGPGAGLCNQIQNMVNTYRNNGLATGVLPPNFFTIQLPPNFWGKQANSYDITTLNGYKLWRLRNAYNTGFGTLFNPGGSSRYLQFGVKLFF